MFDPNNIFHALVHIPILNVLIAVYKALVFLKIPGAFGFSLIILTVLIRLILHPLMATQIRSARKLQKIKPELDRLTSLHKNDKMRLQQEQLALYKKEGINPAAGCLPLLLQMPILIALYNLFFQLLSNGNLDKVIEGINKVVYFPILKITSLDLSFFGMNLAYKPSEWQKYGIYLLSIPVITAVLQYYQTRLMTPPGAKKEEKALEIKKDQTGGKAEDMSATLQKQMGIMMPLMIGFFSFNFPLGLSLYWNTFTLFGIIQQININKEKDTNAG